MVVALSSDKAVWDAVMNNDVVRELRDSFVKGLFNLGKFIPYFPRLKMI